MVTPRVIRLPIMCGQTTCASEPGKFCEWVRSQIDGDRPFCNLFSSRLVDEDGGTTGWLQRCAACRLSEESENNHWEEPIEQTLEEEAR